MAGGSKKKPAMSGHSFKSIFSARKKTVTASAKIESESSERKCVVQETVAKTENMLMDGSRKEQLQTPKRQRLCDGNYSKTSCHPSSRDPCMDDVLVGFQCLNNKMQTGACPLSENVEAIWNARETEVSDAEGLRKEKQYFVKYKGLAHIHNQWIPESRLPLEAEILIEEFNKEREAVEWNKEWAVPHRLLKKRLLLSPNTSGCHYEWLVKWCGLDYKSVSWELETFLSSLHGGADLIEDYQNRHKKALDDSSSAHKDKNGSIVKLRKLPAGSPPGLDNSHLETLNNLREFIHNKQSMIVFDDKERIMMTLLYIVSLSDICQPFLVVTTSSLLPVWEAEFLRAKPSVDTVVYDGSSCNRQCIRTLEFYDDDGRMMLQVLLSSVEFVVEDIPFLKSIKWQVVIVDECQQPQVSSQFGQLKMLAAGVKILLYSGPLKDNVAEYLDLLSLLESCGDSRNIDVLKAESINTLSKLRERLSRYVACDYKSSPTKFVEFWVPSILSNVQLEQYCDTLLSNSLSLRSYSKTDPVGALRDIVFSTRKSCDHPYIVDPSLKCMITKDLPPVSFLDAEIKASGKLQLLEMILSEIKRRHLRVLILFQSGAGSGRDTLGLGDILDDFLRERFGGDTYERVDRGVTSSKLKQTALSNFNKGNGRFMFLLENRACLPSIKLTSVDTIIIYDSDWNPANDVKALNKISIHSQFKQIKIFRLYSAFTVEEKVLILAKQGQTLESNLDSISRATSNKLLMWGASYLLGRLDEFHSTPDMNVSSAHTLSSKVVDEISALLSQSGECGGMDNFSICKIQQKGGIYNSNLKLLGEQQIQLSDDEHPHNFWTNLLNKRILKWKFLSGRTQRQRKKGQYLDDIPKNAECGPVEVGKKRKTGETNCNYPTILNSRLEQEKTGGANGIRGDYGLCCSKGPGASATNLLHPSTVPTVVSEKPTLPEAQNIIDLVKPDFLKLCEILKFSDEVKIIAERFLEYVFSIRDVQSDSESTCQAFLIALCWGSASLSKQKVNRKDSVLLARKHLEFKCGEIEADSIYFSAVRKLKKTFKENMLSDLSNSSISGVQSFREGRLNENTSQLQTVKPDPEEMRKELHTNEISNNFKLIQRKCKKRIEKLKQKQEEEIRILNNDLDVRREEIENNHNVQSVIYTEVYMQPTITDKLKILDNAYKIELEGLKRQKEISLEQLRAKHLDALSNEMSKVEQWLKSASVKITENLNCRDGELVEHAEELPCEVQHLESNVELPPPTDVTETPLQHNQPDLLSTSILDHPPKLNTSTLNSEVVSQVIGRTTEISRKVVIPSGVDLSVVQGFQDLSSPAEHQVHSQILEPTSCSDPLQKEPERIYKETDQTGQIVEDNPLDDDQVTHLAENQPEILQNMVEHAEELPSQVQHLESNVELHTPTDVTVTPLQQNQPDLLSSSTLDHPPKSNASPLNSEAVSQVIGRTTELPGKAVIPSGVDLSVVQGFQDLPLPAEHQVGSQILKPTSYSDPLQKEPERIHKETEQTSQIVEENHVRHLAENQPEIQQNMVEHAEELPSQVQHLESNVELHTPTDVIETPLQENQPDLLSTSTLDHPPKLNTSPLNSEAVSQVIGRTAALPRQAVIPSGVDLSVVQGFQDLPLLAEHQVLSQNLKPTSYSDPLQQELERIQKEIEQTVKLHEDAMMRLKSEFEELMAQLCKRYEDNCKDLDVVFQQKKNELDKNHNKALMNKILADALRCKCAEPSRYNGMQQGVHHGFVQPLNQVPLSSGSRSSAITVSSSAGQPTSCQRNTALILQPSSRVHLDNVTPTTCQPAASQQNTVLPSQHGTRLLPVVASSSGSQLAVKQHQTTLMQAGPISNIITDSSSAAQPAASQQNMAPLLHPSLRISPIVASSSAVQPAANQQSTPPLQIVQQSAALFSSTSTTSMGNLRVGSENCSHAPAPHLQAFRSAASSINLASTVVMPSHLTRSSLPTSSHPLP